jgi:hypothetical protein
MAGLDALVVTIALATIRRDLHASVAQLGWTVNTYVLNFGVLILLGAVLGNRLGRRRVLCNAPGWLPGGGRSRPHSPWRSFPPLHSRHRTGSGRANANLDRFAADEVLVLADAHVCTRG